jgi:2-polyprenyl-6-methoxyphenol hydroxylase-like FAD-dependent oxidoreductase
MSDIRRVLVVGGGVGGLTAATLFARRGVEVLLVERRPVFDVPGVGLGQPANALRIYDALGLPGRRVAVRANVRKWNGPTVLQRSDTLMQDRSPPARRNLLTTHGRTIHWVKSCRGAVKS